MGVDRQKYQIQVGTDAAESCNRWCLVALASAPGAAGLRAQAVPAWVQPLPSPSLPCFATAQIPLPPAIAAGMPMVCWYSSLTHPATLAHPCLLCSDPAAAQDRCQRDDDDCGGEAGRNVQVSPCYRTRCRHAVI